MKKNILILANTTDNEKSMSGGTQIIVQIFKRIREKFNVMYFYTNLNGKIFMENEIKNVSFTVSNKKFDTYNLMIGYVFKMISALSCLRLKNIDVIYSSSDFFPDVVPSFLYKLFHKKTRWCQCVFHIYPDWRKRSGNKLKNFIGKYLQRFSLLLIRKADCIININSQVKKTLIKEGFDENKIIINPPGINFDYLDNIKLNEKKYDASFLARLHYSKGIFDLVEIWEFVCKDIKDAKLAIIGGGGVELKKELEKKIKERGLKNNIDILGFLENNDAFSLMKSSKVFLFPSHEEGFGIVIAEAMACGVPVITWNLTVYDKLFENNIIKIKENDIARFSEKVIILLKDESKIEKLTSKAKKFVKKYDWNEIAKKELEILNN